MQPNVDSDRSSPSDGASSPHEWLVNGRIRRATAGNRMTRLIGADIESTAEDDELNLLFAEDGQEDDTDFDADHLAYASELDFDESTSEESLQSEDNLQGERELEREIRGSKKRMRAPNLASRYTRMQKQKPNPGSQASNVLHDKKTVLNFGAGDFDRHVRVSSRMQTILHRRAAQEAVSRKPIDNSRPSSTKRAILKSSHLSQEERLAKANHIEAQNSKSLHHWQDAENTRLTQQRARMRELRDRGIDGPSIRWYSGPARFVDGVPVAVGKKALNDRGRVTEGDSLGLPNVSSHDKNTRHQADESFSEVTPITHDGAGPDCTKFESLQSLRGRPHDPNSTELPRGNTDNMLQCFDPPPTTISPSSSNFKPRDQGKSFVNIDGHKPGLLGNPNDVSPTKASSQPDEHMKDLSVYNAITIPRLKAEDQLDSFVATLTSRRREPRTRLNKPTVQNCSITGTLATYKDPFTRLCFSTPSSYHMIARLLCDQSRFNCDLGIYVGCTQDESHAHSSS